MAAKRTSDIIPMCHPINTTGIDISFNINSDNIEIFSRVKCKGETGVEMEALTAVSAAALTIYDMGIAEGYGDKRDKAHKQNRRKER